MIPKIEEIIKAQIEKRITTALPELAISEAAPVEGAPATVVTRVESRKPERCVQEESGVIRYGQVEATISCTFYNLGQQFVDKTALLVSFMSCPSLQLADGVFANCELDGTELADGPHLDSDVWVFKVKYPLFEYTEEQNWQQPVVNIENPVAAALYPQAQAYDPDAPEAQHDE